MNRRVGREVASVAVLRPCLQLPHLLRIARRTANLALTIDPRQALARIEDDPSPLVELVFEERQQRAFRGRLDTVPRKQRAAIQIEVLGIQALVMLHRVEKGRVMDYSGSDMTRAQVAARLAHVAPVLRDDGVLKSAGGEEIIQNPRPP